jgi:hypothetical protein
MMIMTAHRTLRPPEVAWPPWRITSHGRTARRAWTTARRTFGRFLDGIRPPHHAAGLGDLDDHTLHDIGLERFDGPSVLGRSGIRVIMRHRD